MDYIGNISRAFKKALNAPRQRREDRDLFLGAATNSAWQIVRDLAEKYPEAVRWRDETGATALHFAVFYKNPKMIHYLLDKGADIEAADHKGARPLHVAALCTGEYATGTLLALTGRGADLNAPNKLGTTPLLHAVVRNKPGNVRDLIIAGADEFITNKTGYSALSAAKEVRRQTPALYAAIEDGKAERLRRDNEERRLIAEELRHSLVLEAIDRIGNGLDSDISIMRPVRLAK